MECGDWWPGLKDLPLLSDLTVIQVGAWAARPQPVGLCGRLLPSGCTSLQAISRRRRGFVPPEGLFFIRTLRRLDVTLETTTTAADSMGQLGALRDATQLSELRLRGLWPIAEDIEVLSRMRRLRSLKVEHALGALLLETGHAVGRLQRRLPSVAVTCVEPDTTCGTDDERGVGSNDNDADA